MKVSSLTICKNEDEIIQDMLEYLENVVDEIIVVDGGSLDNTPVLLAKFALKSKVPVIWFNHKMPNSFAEQRNFAISKCTGDWILHTDADEQYTPSLKVGLESLISRKGVMGYSFPTFHLFPDDKHYVNEDADPHIRLFRNNSKIKYEGKIHEFLTYKGVKLYPHPSHFDPYTQKYVKYISNIRLLHYGYLRPKQNVIKKIANWKENDFMKISEKAGIPIKEEDWLDPKPKKVKDIKDAEL